MVVKGEVADDVGETLPQGAALHATAHVTPLLDESLETVAVICAVPPASTVLAEEEAEIEIAGVEPPPHPASNKPKLANRRTRNLFMFTPGHKKFGWSHLGPIRDEYGNSWDVSSRTINCRISRAFPGASGRPSIAKLFTVVAVPCAPECPEVSDRQDVHRW